MIRLTQMRRLGLLLLFAAVGCLAHSQTPENFCGSFNEINAFELNWTMPAGADPNLVYRVFKDQGAGFALIAAVNPATNTTFTDFGIDPAQPPCYYVQSVLDGVLVGTPTDTICGVFLTLNASNPSLAQLSWTAPYSPMPAEGSFAVFRSVDANPVEQVASLPANALSHTDTLFSVCDETPAEYYVEWQGALCNSASLRRTDDFTDLLPPPQPIVETASVDPNSGDIIINWAPINVPDLAFYRIQDIDLGNQQFVNVGVVNAGEAPEFVYNNAGLNGVKTLAVIAFDDCGNDASFAGTATTMFAEADYTECNLEAMVSWTPYQGWSEGVAGYEIWAIIDEADPVLMATADASETFAMVEVDPNRAYCFYLEASSNGNQRNATSNSACVQTDYPNIASSVYLSGVSVVENRTIEVSIVMDPNAVGTTYELFRSRFNSGFVKVGNFNQVNTDLLTYVDENVDTRSTRYRYRWDAYDGCGALIGSSNLGSNIVLEAIAETRELTNFLSWNAFEQWDNGVAVYEIWRAVGAENDFELYTTVPGDQLIFDDDVEQFREEEGEFCYKVVAVENDPPHGITGRSESSSRCVTQPPIMWIPSAIYLSGQPENRVFKPVTGFIDLDTFRMEIYNKWGQRIFNTNQVNDGWDGTFRGNQVRQDFYRYIITYSDGSGRPYVEQDVLYVIH